MELFLLSAQPNKAVAVIVIALAFGSGLAGGLFAYFKVIKNKDGDRK